MMRSGLALLLLAGLTHVASSQETKTITLAVSHPGFESKKPEKHDLTLTLDAQGNPQAYSMKVKSVFCSDEKCDVITLIMQWDYIGRFMDYQLPEGTRLTKYEHEAFEKADYTKFDQLMKNRSSLLGELGIEQLIVKHKNHDKNTKQGTKAAPKDVADKGDALQKVDAISGATPSYIQEEVVEGAAYTCFTMWHWANGDTAKQIRAHSQGIGSAQWLGGLLSSKSTDEVDFALEAIAKRKLHDAAIQKQAIAAAEHASTQGPRLLIDYLHQANPKSDESHMAYLQLLQAPHGKARVMLLEHLLKQKEAPPISFLEQTAELLPRFERFYELQLLLSLAEKHQAESDKFLTAVSQMLAHDNFFFSRRAHAFLKARKLPDSVKSAVQAYEKQHAGRL